MIEKHVPTVFLGQSHFPLIDRDNWLKKYGRLQFKNFLTKLGSRNQTKDWRFLDENSSKKVLIFSIYQQMYTKNDKTGYAFGLTWNTGFTNFF